MGTKRIGLSRQEHLFENLKRDLAMGGSSLRGTRRKVLRQTVFGAARTLTVAESGALILLDEDAVTNITLPIITSSDYIGVSYEFLETVVSDNARGIHTSWPADHFVGGVSNLFDAAGDTDVLVTFVSAGATDTIITLGDDNLANAGGGLGANVTLTAVLTGNVANGGGAKLVWAVTGTKIAQAATDTGAAFFT
tara:strand:+ start:233 stop:814 length:582 start_codon:yes stop_codon:yes gene_type:complete